MSEHDITPKISNQEVKTLDILNVQQNNLTNDKNRHNYNDDNTSSNTHKFSERNAKSNKSDNSLE